MAAKEAAELLEEAIPIPFEVTECAEATLAASGNRPNLQKRETRIQSRLSRGLIHMGWPIGAPLAQLRTVNFRVLGQCLDRVDLAERTIRN